MNLAAPHRPDIAATMGAGPSEANNTWGYDNA